MLSTTRQVFGLATYNLLGGLCLLGLLLGPSTATAQAPPPPVDGIKVAPVPFPALPPGVEIPAEISAQFALDRDFSGFPEAMAIAPVSKTLDDVYYLTDGNYQAMAILRKDGNGIILVDAPEPLPFADVAIGVPPFDIITTLKDEFPGLSVTHMIYSHGHTDHIGGAQKIKDEWPNVQIIAHEETQKDLAEILDPKRPVPDVTFSDFMEFEIGGQKLELHNFGNTHQPGNTYIYLPKQKVLMVVDIIFPGWVPFRRLALSEDIRGWLKGHDAILQFNFKTLVAGHLTILGNNDSGVPAKKHVIWAKEYNDEIAASIEAGYLDPTTLFEGVGVIFGADENAFATNAKWALFSAFFDASTQRCVEALKISTGQWKGKLAGEETFNFANCEAYFAARRVGNVGESGQ